MKTILISITSIVVLTSCNGIAGFSGNADSTSTSADSALGIYRDESINASNAYSDLFLDSNAVASYIQKENLDGSTAQMLRNFYMVRNNQYAWFTSQGLTEQARGFWSLYSNNNKDSKDSKNNQSGGNVSKDLRSTMDSLVQRDTVMISTADSSYVKDELALTTELIKFANKESGTINKHNVYFVVPRKKMDPMQLADSLLNRQRDSAAFAANKQYGAMKQQLSIYYNAAKNGGWQNMSSANGLKKGAKSPAVVALKKRLQATNDYTTSDTTNMFSDSLAAAVKDVQRRNGLAPTGNVNDSLLAVLNVPAEQRVQQILLNMNRLVWMPATNDSNRIEVSIPSQMLYAYEGSNKVFEMPVIVGKEGTSTIAFSGKINQIVFNPTWNVPASIVKNEIMPAMKKDPNYLKNKNMEITNQNDSTPTIKQLPGKENALGKVKFLFPNSYDIYLHDTPNKSLFRRKDRALSHGCIRVADAEKLAQYLLRNQSDWTAEKIHAAMNSGNEQTVAVQNPEPVHINYLSAWVDETGKMNFRDDIYGHDNYTLARMFTTGGNMQNVATMKTDSSNVKTDSATKKTAKP